MTAHEELLLLPRASPPFLLHFAETFQTRRQINS